MQQESPEGTIIQQKSSFLDRLYRKIGLPAILIIIVCLAVLITHWPALSAQALSFDDGQYLTKNVLVQNPGWASTRRFLSEVLEPSSVEGYYQPLAMISLMFDYALGGRENNMMPFHRTSLILHVANTALIIILLYLLFGQIWVAAGVGLLFGVHPMTVEPIPWVGERKTLLAAFFSLWSLIFYFLFTIYYLRATSDQRRATKFYIGSLVAYLLALMSKPTSVPIPAMMLLMDYWPLRRLNWRAVWEKVPFFVLGGISAIITYISQSRTACTVLPTEFGVKFVPLIISHNIIFYLYKMVWPVNLSSHYAFPEPLNLSQPMVLAGVIGTLILIPLLVLSLRRTRAALTGWLIFFAAILPTLQIIGFTNVIASDKFAYLPSVGLLMVLASFLVWLCSVSKNTLKYVIAIIIVILAAAEGTASRRYLGYWQNTLSLYEYMLTLTPDESMVRDNLAYALYTQGKIDEAVSHYGAALHFNPYQASTYNNLGVAMEAKGNFDEAINYYHQAIRFKPNYAEAYYNLGHLQQARGKLDEAIESYSQAINIKPDYPEAHNNLAVVFQSQRKFDEAIVHFREALKYKSDSADIYYNIGITFAMKENFDEAINYYNQTLRIKPDDADVHYKLGVAFEGQGKFGEAIKCFHKAINIDPNWSLPLNAMAQILAMHPDPNIRDANEASALAERAAELTKYQDPSILNTLAIAYGAKGQLDMAVTTAEKALALASAAQNNQLADSIRKRLELYRQKINNSKKPK
jgi:tetratricopeptide (TPR) repeat protein